jgi:hypothetical protein
VPSSPLSTTAFVAAKPISGAPGRGRGYCAIATWTPRAGAPVASTTSTASVRSRSSRSSISLAAVSSTHCSAQSPGARAAIESAPLGVAVARGLLPLGPQLACALPRAGFRRRYLGLPFADRALAREHADFGAGDRRAGRRIDDARFDARRSLRRREQRQQREGDARQRHRIERSV